MLYRTACTRFRTKRHVTNGAARSRSALSELKDKYATSICCSHLGTYSHGLSVQQQVPHCRRCKIANITIHRSFSIQKSQFFFGSLSKRFWLVAVNSVQFHLWLVLVRSKHLFTDIYHSNLFPKENVLRTAELRWSNTTSPLIWHMLRSPLSTGLSAHAHRPAARRCGGSTSSYWNTTTGTNSTRV